jgi:hypothetical protein
MSSRTTIITSPLFQPTPEQKQAARMRMRDALQIVANCHPELFLRRPVADAGTNEQLPDAKEAGERHDDAA